ncbi:MAG: hypothetical protein ABFD54_13910 [Armatimonadota bacterium]|nr:hypothetical protein [bacterium]
MKIHHVLCSIALLFFIGAVPSIAAIEDEQGGWHKVQSSGVVIEFQDGLGPLARQLMPEAIKLAQDGPQAQREREINKLMMRKNEILRFVAAQLDLAKPNKESINYFNSIGQVMTAFPGPRHIRLWHTQMLRDAVKVGDGVPCVIYNPESDQFDTLFHAKMFNGIVFAPAPLSIPIDVSFAKPQLDQALEYLNAQQKKVDLNSTRHAFFHEITEIMIITSTPLKGCCFRRWICDGMADYVGELCLGRFVGKSVMKKYMEDQVLRINEFASLREQVDLVGWRAVEWENELPNKMRSELIDPHYTFAAYEIRELVKRHGPDVLPKIFREIRKVRADGGQMILDAISKVTCEDFAARLSAYGAKNNDEFKGIGFFQFQVFYLLGDNTAPITNGTEVPLITDGEHGIAGSVFVDTLNYPLEVKWEVSGASNRKWVGGRKEKSNIVSEDEYPLIQYVMSELFSSGKLKPGDNTLSLYLQGKLAKQVKFKLVPASGS